MKSYIKSEKHIGLETKILSSCQAFIQSRRQTNVVTFSGKRAARVLLTMYPEELNSCSHGTDVAGKHNSFFYKVCQNRKTISVESPPGKGIFRFCNWIFIFIASQINSPCIWYICLVITGIRFRISKLQCHSRFLGLLFWIIVIAVTTLNICALVMLSCPKFNRILIDYKISRTISLTINRLINR